jgi:membrane complex biogenesis BtpA family protein
MWTRTYLEARLRPPVIGMIHLDPLPGSPGYAGDLAAVIDAAVVDLVALRDGGITAAMVENFHDAPFWPDRVPPETVAAMTAAAVALRRAAPDMVLGVNVLRNDAASALAIAGAAGASLIRVNVHTGAAVTDQGPLSGQAHLTVRRRRDLGLDEVAILADLRVKHAAPLAGRDPAEEARDLRLRGRADAIIVSGPATGAPADPADLRAVREAVPDCPLLVGSGVTEANCHHYEAADGVIVGSSFKTAGRIDAGRVRAFLAAWGRGKDPA